MTASVFATVHEIFYTGPNNQPIFVAASVVEIKYKAIN